jgi:hypothetical protein
MVSVQLELLSAFIRGVATKVLMIDTFPLGIQGHGFQEDLNLKQSVYVDDLRPTEACKTALIRIASYSHLMTPKAWLNLALQTAGTHG